MQRQFLHLTSPNERLEDTIKHWTSMAVVNTAIKLTLILLIIQPFVYCVNEQDGLTCLAERLPSSDKTFQECRTLTLETNQTTFCTNDTCRNHYTSAFNYCGLCNPFQLACEESTTNYSSLTCLFVEATGDGLGECQRKRSEEGLTAYCLDESCYFIEEAFNKCGFAWHGCNPVRETCDKHFRSVLPQCNSGGKPATTITAIMILMMCSILMI
ncbi:uncharacterized protein LOC135337303 [Halichondria panicea]|uniref:uncharacterized protein LOC135337303 n=1 Tax=Halichondria panicea TaxID=6063 RepID=UPI00312B37CC